MVNHPLQKRRISVLQFQQPQLPNCLDIFNLDVQSWLYTISAIISASSFCIPSRRKGNRLKVVIGNCHFAFLIGKNDSANDDNTNIKCTQKMNEFCC